jgi:hypothetical protein
MISYWARHHHEQMRKSPSGHLPERRILKFQARPWLLYSTPWGTGCGAFSGRSGTVYLSDHTTGLVQPQMGAPARAKPERNKPDDHTTSPSSHLMSLKSSHDLRRPSTSNCLRAGGRGEGCRKSTIPRPYASCGTLSMSPGAPTKLERQKGISSPDPTCVSEF